MRCTGTSAQRHGSSEFCSILNRAIREDDPNTTIHAAVFASAINILLMKDHAPQPWLQQFFPEKFPYVIDVRRNFTIGFCMSKIAQLVWHTAFASMIT